MPCKWSCGHTGHRVRQHDCHHRGCEEPAESAFRNINRNGAQDSASAVKLHVKLSVKESAVLNCTPGWLFWNCMESRCSWISWRGHISGNLKYDCAAICQPIDCPNLWPNAVFMRGTTLIRLSRGTVWTHGVLQLMLLASASIHSCTTTDFLSWITCSRPFAWNRQASSFSGLVAPMLAGGVLQVRIDRLTDLTGQELWRIPPRSSYMMGGSRV